jgi:hypothetical protein
MSNFAKHHLSKRICGALRHKSFLFFIAMQVLLKRLNPKENGGVLRLHSLLGLIDVIGYIPPKK